MTTAQAEQHKSAARLSLENSALVAASELHTMRGSTGFTDDCFNDSLIRNSPDDVLRAIIGESMKAADALG